MSHIKDRLIIVSLAITLPLLIVGEASSQLKNLALRTTANFKIRHERNIPADQVQLTGSIAEDAYRHCKKNLGRGFPGAVDIVVLGNKGRFRIESNSKAYSDVAFANGRIYISAAEPATSDSATLHKSLLRAISRALVNNIGSCPAWLAEAYSISVGDDYQRFGKPARLTTASFSDLAEDFSRAERERDVQEAYAKVALTAQFLTDRYGQKKFDALILSLRKGATFREAMVMTFGERMEEIERAWAAALRAAVRG